jgi:RNA polymerase sigma-70 factor (ECF subfamily)
MMPQKRLAESPDDSEVIMRIASGDLQSLGLLFDRHEPNVRRVLARLGVSLGDIDDVIQSTFLEVVGAAAHFDPRFSVRSWLLGIAAMMARRHRRSVGSLARRLSTWSASLVPPEPPTPGDAFDSREIGRRMAKAVARLSPKRREAFVLVAIEGASGEEAAAALGIPLNTLWTRLHHARQDLRAWLLEVRT